MGSKWRQVSLGDLFKVKHGFAFKGEFFTDEPTDSVLVTPGNFAVGGGFQNPKPKYYNGPVPGDYVLAPGQVVVTMTDLSKQSDTLGLATIIPDDDYTWLHNQRIGLLEFREDFPSDRVFVSYLLRTHEYRSWVVGSATGTTVKHTSPSRIEAFSCSIPPLREQQGIAHILGALDEKIELNRQMNATLEAMGQALFKSWFVDFDPVIDNALAAGNLIPEPLHARAEARAALGDQRKPLPAAIQQQFPSRFVFTEEMGWVPEGWDVLATEEVAEKIGMGPFGSNIKVSTFVETGVPVISGKHLNRTLLTDENYNHVTKEHAQRLTNSVVKSGDVIFTHAGNIGQVSLIPTDTAYPEYVISQRQFYLRPDTTKALSSYLVYFFRSPIGQHKLLANASQVGVPSIARPSSHLKAIKLLLPSFPLLKRFDDECKAIFNATISNQRQIDTLPRIRDTLLPKLLSGQLRLPEAEALAERTKVAV